MKAHKIMSNSFKTSTSLDQLSNIVSSIYDAALDENKWETVLTTLASILKAEQGNLRIIQSDLLLVDRVYTFNKDPYWTQAFIDHYIHICPWVKRVFSTQQTILDCTHHLIPDREYVTMEVYQELVLPQDIHYGIGGKINLTNSNTCYLTFQRGLKRSGFEQASLDFLHSLAPHFQKAILINEKTRKLELQQSTLKDSLNQINTPLLIVNQYGKTIFINAAAEKIVAEQQGILLKNGYIFLTSPEDNKQLHKLIKQAINGADHELPKQGGSMCSINARDQSMLSLLVSPINPDRVDVGISCSETALILLNTNSPPARLPSDLLIALYNLTPAEARLAVELCQGFTLDEISEKHKLSKNTLKSQLRACFAKTGATRQADLINLINTGPAGSKYR